MKKIIAILMSALLIAAMLSVAVSAANPAPTMTVTEKSNDGKTAVYEISVTKNEYIYVLVMSVVPSWTKTADEARTACAPNARDNTAVGTGLKKGALLETISGGYTAAGQINLVCEAIPSEDTGIFATLTVNIENAPEGATLQFIVREASDDLSADLDINGKPGPNNVIGEFVVKKAVITEAPTQAPTEAPTQAPTQAPTEAPTQAPTQAPTEAPTQAPTQAPTEAPTQAPTQAPTEAPTAAPTEAPTAAPTEPVTEPQNPDTGDAIALYAIIAVVAVLGTAVVIRKKVTD